jgi:hypothetical protein
MSRCHFPPLLDVSRAWEVEIGLIDDRGEIQPCKAAGTAFCSAICDTTTASMFSFLVIIRGGTLYTLDRTDLPHIFILDYITSNSVLLV